MPATPRANWARAAWNRAAAGQRAQLATVRISDDRVTESALRLDRTHDRLNRCEPRITRGQRRRV